MNGEWEICSVFLLLSSALVDTRSLVNYTLCHSFLYSFPLKIYFNKGTMHLFLKKIQVNVLDIIFYLYFITFQFHNEMFLVNQLFIGCSVSFHCSEKAQEVSSLVHSATAMLWDMNTGSPHSQALSFYFPLEILKINPQCRGSLSFISRPFH